MLDTQGRLPAVLPVVLYNGETPWRAAREVGELVQPAGEALAPYRPAQRYHLLDERHIDAHDLPGHNLVTALVRLEQSRSHTDLAPVWEMVRECLHRPADTGLKQVLADWMRDVLQRFTSEGVTLPAQMTFEEVGMTIEERAAEWPKQWLREGREQGMREGMAQGVREGMAQGIREGIAQVLAHERALLRRLAALRFGAETAERLAALLADISDPERLAEVGEWLVRCGTGSEFLARVEPDGTRVDPKEH